QELNEINDKTDVLNLLKATKEYYISHINKDLISWGIKIEQNIVSIVSLCLFNRIPYSENLLGKEGYLLNVYTIKEFRKQGFSRLLVETAINYSKNNNIKKIWLNTSEQGKSIYEKCGFIKKDSEMELLLDHKL
ncbi:MAG: GNAT family N-acetyltransferase, partial [Oscillospiraceae bacterium]